MGFFEKIKRSITEPAFYREIAGQSAGKAIKYFILLFTLVFLVGGVFSLIGFNRGFSAFLTEAEENLPEFTLANGELSVNAEQPYTVSEDPLFIIDTTGKTDPSVLDDELNGILVTKTQLITKQPAQTQTVNFSDLKELSITKDDLLNFAPVLRWIVIPLALFAYAGRLAGMFILALILSVIALIINAIMKSKLEFGGLWNIVLYALTLPMLLDIVKRVLILAGVYVSPLTILYNLAWWALVIVYIVLALKAFSKEEPEEERPNLII